jgi:hypothetical protein
MIGLISILLLEENTGQNHLGLQRSLEQLDTLLGIKTKNSVSILQIQLF